MKNNHVLHGAVTASLFALNIAIIAVFLLTNTWHSYLRGEMPVQVAAVIVPVLLVTLLVLVVEWRGVVNAGKIEEESLASVERNHPYLPRLPQRVLTGVLSVVAVVVMIPVITRATASSGELLHIFSGSGSALQSQQDTGEANEKTDGSGVAAIGSGSRLASSGSLVTGTGAVESGTGLLLAPMTGTGSTEVSDASGSVGSADVPGSSDGTPSSVFSSQETSAALAENTETTTAVLTLESRNGARAFEASQSPSFTLVETSIPANDPAVRPDGTLHDTRALTEIVRSVVDGQDILQATAKAIVDHAQGEIAKQVTEDSVSVNTLKETLSAGDAAAPRLDQMQATVQTNIDASDTIKTEVSQALVRDSTVQLALEKLSTEDVKQAIAESIAEDIVAQISQNDTSPVVIDDAAIFKAAQEASPLAMQTAEKSIINSMSEHDDMKQFIAGAVVHAASVQRDTPSLAWSDDEVASGSKTNINPVISVKLTGNNGQVIYPNYHFKRGSVVLVLEPEQAFTPGVYTLEVEITNPFTGEVTTQSQEFAWGVLAMNPDKDRYHPGETAHIAIGVLDDNGEMVCDAAVHLHVESPDGSSSDMRTSDGTMVKNAAACATKNSAQITPDYTASVQLPVAGTYKMTLEASTPNGTRSIQSDIFVAQSLPYAVERVAATRLFPVGWSPMTVSVRFADSFHGTIRDILPAGFVIRPAEDAAVVMSETGSSIAWSGNWSAGETAVFSYEYDAPDISPQFYLVGPLQMQSEQDVWQETRSWQIANDAPSGTITGKVYSNEGITPLAGKTVAVSLNGAAAAGTAVTDAGGQYTISGLTFTGGTIVSLYLDNNTENAVTVSTGSGGGMTGMTLYQDQLIIRSGTGGNATITSSMLNIADNNTDADISTIYTIGTPSLPVTLGTGKKLYIWTGSTLSLGGNFVANKVHLDGSFRPNNSSLTIKTEFTQSGGTLFGSSAAQTMGDISIDNGTFIATSGTLTNSGSFIHTAGTFTHNSGTMSFTASRTSSIDVPATETFNGIVVNTAVNAVTLQIGTGDIISAVGTAQLQNGKLKTGTINPQRAFTINSTWDGGTHSILFSGTSNQAWNVGGVTSDAFVTVNKSSGKVTLLAGNGYATNTGITVLSGSFSMQNASLTMAGGLSVAAGATMVSTGSIFMAPNNSTALINFAGSGYILNASLAGTSGGRISLQTGSVLPVRGTLTFGNNGIINGGGLIDVKGNIVQSGVGVTGNAPVRLSGTGTQVIRKLSSGSFSNGSVTIAKPSGEVVLSGSLLLSGASQKLIMTGGTLNLNGNTLTVGDIFTIGTGTTLKLKGTETITGGPDFLHRGSTVYYTEPSQTLRLKNFVPNYQNIVLGSTGSAVFRPSRQGMTMSGNLTISGGTLQFDGGQSLTISGSYVRTGGTLSSGTGTINILTQGQTKTWNETSSLYNLNIDDGLIGYWKFDEGVGTTAKDSSRYGYNGTLTNGPTWSGSGLYSSKYHNPKSLLFDGVNDYVTVGDMEEVDNAQQLSVCAWVKHLSDTADQGIVHKRATSSPGILLFRDDVGLTGKTDIYTFYIEAPGLVSTRVDTATNSATAGIWRHVCGVYRANNALGLQLFINGTEAATPVSTIGFSTNLNAGSQPLQIGTRDGNLSQHGFIDDVRIYNRALSASEISALAAGNPATGSGKLLLANNLDINGSLGIYGSTLDVSASNYSVNIAGNVQNSGDFVKRSGTVTLDGTSAQTVSGSTLWNNLSKTVLAAQTLFLDYTSRQSASGALTLRGAVSNLLSLRSTRSGSGARLLLDGDSGTQTLDYLNVKDSNATGGQSLVCLTASEGCIDSGNTTNWTFAAGITGTGTVKGLVFNDTNGNGTKNAGETGGLSSVTVTLSGTSATGGIVSRSTTTNANGQFFFSGSTISNTTGYTVAVTTGTLPANYLRTRFNSSGSNVLGTGGLINVNFGYVQTSTGTGRIFIDANDNGIADTGESLGINGSTVTLTATSATGGLMVLSSTTVTNGRWSFLNLPPLTGTLAITTSTIPSGYRPTALTSSGVSILQGGSTLTQNFGYFWYGTLSGSVFIDSNANGIRDGGETGGFSGATITVTGTTASGGALTAVQRTTSTGAFFLTLPQSNTSYTLALTAPANYVITTASSFNRAIGLGTHAPSSLFGIKSITGTGTVKGLVFNDTNGNGTKNAGETGGLSSVTVTLSGTSATGGIVSRSTTTNANGQFFFSGSTISNTTGYTVAVTTGTLPANYLRTRFNSSGSNVLGTGGLINVNFGYVQTSTGTGRIFIDANDNGIADTGESLGINGSTVTLTATSATGGLMVLSSTTVTNGRWSFLNLPPLTGTLAITTSTIPSGYRPTALTSSGVSILQGGSTLTQNFGYFWYGTLSGSVFIDSNANGIRDGGETGGFSGATITVTGTTASGGALTAVQRTTSTGAFAAALPQSTGNYTVSIDVPVHYRLTTPGSTTRSVGLGLHATSSVFGIQYVSGTGVVKGMVFSDADGDGIHDASEQTGFSGSTISLTGLTATGASVNRTAVSNALGRFFFSGAVLSNSAGYTATIAATPSGYLRTRFNSSGSNVLGTGGVVNIEFGYVQTSTLSGSLYIDANSNAIRDSGENAIFSGATVTLTGVTATGGSIQLTTTTSATGSYLFTGLPTSNGGFLVVATPPTGYTTTSTNSRSVVVTTGGSRMHEDFGYVVQSSSSSSSSSVSSQTSAAGTQEVVTSGGGRRINTGPTIRIPVEPIESGEAGAGSYSSAASAPAAVGSASSASSASSIPWVRIPVRRPATETDAATQLSDPVEFMYQQQEENAQSAIVKPLDAAGSIVQDISSGILQSVQDAASGFGDTIADAASQTAQVMTTVSANARNTGFRAFTSIVDSIASVARGLDASATTVVAGVTHAADSVRAAGRSIASVFDSAKNTAAHGVAFAYVSAGRFTSEVLAGIQAIPGGANRLLSKETFATPVLDRPLPPKKYQTEIARKNDTTVIRELSFNIIKSFGEPYRQTPVILFSTPKIAVTDNAGNVTFHDVEVGTHHIEVHIDDKTVETREVVVEPPASLHMDDNASVSVKLPLIEIKVESAQQAVMHGSAPANMPWYWIVVIPLLVSNGVMGFLLIVHRQRRVQEGKMQR